MEVKKMKTGNSILAAFFFYMAFKIPVEINTLALAYDIPEIEFYKLLSVLLFAVCIILGCLSLEYGRESKIKNVKIVGEQYQLDKPLDMPPFLKKDTTAGINAVNDVDKDLPVLKVVDEDGNKDFRKISDRINNVIEK